MLGTLVTLAVVGASTIAIAAPVPTVAADRGTFLGVCTNSDDCASGLYCYQFKKRGAHCTKSCDSDIDCPAPSRGCTERHQCGMPR